VVTQYTNPDLVAALNFPVEFQFLFFKQNLPRETTVELSGTGLVKGNSTSTKILYRKEFPIMDFLILSILLLLPR
jgi:hypothetical protein